MLKHQPTALALLSVLLSGCVNFGALDKFADGAQMLAQASGEFYLIELDTDRRLAGLTVDLEEPAQPGRVPWQEATAGANLIAEARRHKAAVAALAHYASSLKSIAHYDNEQAVQKSAKNLSKHLGALAQTLDSSANPDESALAKAITNLANLYAGVKVKKIVLEKVEQAQPHVETIVNILVADIKRQQQRFELTRLSASAKREQWFNAFKRDYLSGRLSASEKSFVAMAAGDLVEAELADKLAERPARNFLTQLNNTAASCLAAHQAIRNSDLKTDAQELVSFIDESRQLLIDVRNLK